jgi:hypothetical protein
MAVLPVRPAEPRNARTGYNCPADRVASDEAVDRAVDRVTRGPSAAREGPRQVGPPAVHRGLLKRRDVRLPVGSPREARPRRSPCGRRRSGWRQGRGPFRVGGHGIPRRPLPLSLGAVATLTYGIAKNHILLDGDKRAAFYALVHRLPPGRGQNCDTVSAAATRRARSSSPSWTTTSQRPAAAAAERAAASAPSTPAVDANPVDASCTSLGPTSPDCRVLTSTRADSFVREST